LSTGIHIHQHNRMEQLAERLGHVLLTNAPADPFEPQYVVVGSSGMREWLRGALAMQLPVVTGIEFGFAPGLGDWLVGGDAQRGRQWQVGNLVWHVLAALRALRGDPDLKAVNAYFDRVAERQTAAPSQEGALSVAEYEIARQIATLFERYTRNAPALCRSFDAGTMPVPLVDHTDALWQMRIWRWIRENAPESAHMPGLLAELFASEPLAAHVPRQINIFGLSNLPAVHYEAVARLADRIRVDWFLLTPTRMYIGEDRRRELEQAWDTDATMEKSPLLLAFGKATRGAQRMTLDLQRFVTDAPFVEDDLFDAPADIPRTGPRGVPMLERIHRGLLDDTETPIDLLEETGESALPVADDLSLRIYSCASDGRQVEMLRESLLHLFDSEPDLQPRDVLVMTPDVARFAPIIQAVFGDLGRPLSKNSDAPVVAVPATPPIEDDADERETELEQETLEPAAPVVGSKELPWIPYRIVDRSLREANPMAHVLVRLFSLSRSRATRTELVSFLGLEPVRARFDLSSEDVAEWAVWFERLGVRYGRDGEDRAGFGGPSDNDLFSWRLALDRLAVSAAMSAGTDAWYHERATDDGLAGQRPETVGKCLRATQTVLSVAAQLVQPVSAQNWRELLLGSGESANGLLQLVADASGARAWMWREVVDALMDLEQGVRNGQYATGSAGDDARAQQSGPPIQPAVLERYLDTRFDVPIQMSPTGRNAVMFCSLQPSRSVPHQVICLLGLDDGVFPRGQASVRWDLTTPSTFGGRMSVYNRMPMTEGEDGLLPLTFLDPRDADRTLFLEAILSARQALHIFYTGRDASTGKEIPPAAPVSELMRFTRPMDTDSQQASRTTYHFEAPLHAFSVQAFVAHELAGNSMRSHHPLQAELAAHIAGRVASGSADRWSWWSPKERVSTGAETQSTNVWTINEWARWTSDPIEEFARRVLRVRPPDLADVADELIPIGADGLQAWKASEEAWTTVVRSAGSLTANKKERIIERMVQVSTLSELSDGMVAMALERAEELYAAIGSDWVSQTTQRYNEPVTGLVFVAPRAADGSSSVLMVTASSVKPEAGSRAEHTLRMALILSAAAVTGSVHQLDVFQLRSDEVTVPATLDTSMLIGTPAAWLRYYAGRAIAARRTPPFVIGTPSVLACREVWGELPAEKQTELIDAFSNGSAEQVAALARECVPLMIDPTSMRAIAAPLRNAWKSGKFDAFGSVGDGPFWTWFAEDAPYWRVEGREVHEEFLLDSLLQWFPLVASGLGVK
jgi:exodeoxyribonuclease V gamma subunit